MEALIETLARQVRSDLAQGRLVLPSLPDIVFRLSALLGDPGTTGDDIASLVGRDPALSARFLRMANSAYFPGMRPVADLRRAVVRLGHKVIKHLVTTLAVSKLYDVRAHPVARPHLLELWRQSTLVASLAEVIARRLGHLEPEVAMLAGLVHRIGAMPVIVRGEQEAELMANRDAVQALIDAVHREVGAAIVTAWRFPPELVAVVTEHDDLGRDGPALADYVDVVQVARLVGYRGTGHRWGDADWSRVPAFLSVGLENRDLEDLMAFAGARVGELRRVLGPLEGRSSPDSFPRRTAAGAAG
jgi:putative nucleotidyltransferase with HDIG domain